MSGADLTAVFSSSDVEESELDDSFLEAAFAGPTFLAEAGFAAGFLSSEESELSELEESFFTCFCTC